MLRWEWIWMTTDRFLSRNSMTTRLVIPPLPKGHGTTGVVVAEPGPPIMFRGHRLEVARNSNSISDSVSVYFGNMSGEEYRL